MRETPPLLRMQNICKRFPGVQALDNVHLTLQAGEVHALLGENGAGKSTLINILNGLVAADSGDIIMDGHPVDIRNQRDAEACGIAIIHQEMSLIPALSVAENICLGNYPVSGPWRAVDWRQMRKLSERVLQRIDFFVDPDTPLEYLSIAQQQLVEIARALLKDARVVVMDEPTSTLTPREIDVLYRVVDELRSEGRSIVFISHKLDEVERLADRVTVLRNGRRVGTLERHEMVRSQLVQMMIGKELAEHGEPPDEGHPHSKSPHDGPPQRSHQKSPHNGPPQRSHTKSPYNGTSVDEAAKEQGLGPPLLAVENLTDGHHFFELSFQLRAGEVLGIAGLVGAGRSELLEALSGARPVEGSVQVAGRAVRFGSPQEALRAGIAYLPENRREKGLFLRMGLGLNVTAAQLARFASLGFVRQKPEQDYAELIRERFGIRASGLQQRVGTLSGGNQQKAVLARCVDTGASIILLNEPTRGVDIGAKAEIYRLIQQLKAEGRAFIVVSSELPELLRVSDRIAVMARGRLTTSFFRHEATQDRLLRAMFGEVHPSA